MPEADVQFAVADSMPNGFKNLFVESSRLRRLKQFDASTLDGTVEEYGNNKITEAEIIEAVAQRRARSYLTPERTIAYPGLNLAINDNLLHLWAAGYKKDNDTPSGTIKDPERAGVDDIVFSPLTPAVFKKITDDDTLSPNFVSSGLSGGDELPVIADKGHDTDANTAGETLSIGTSEQIFLTGDFIDLSQGQSVVSGTQYNDVDGHDFGPTDVLMQSRHSGTHILTTQATYATDTLNLHAGVYDDGDAELVPVGFYLGPGRKAPDLI